MEGLPVLIQEVGISGVNRDHLRLDYSTICLVLYLELLYKSGQECLDTEY